MKLHFSKILLFFIPSNILLTSYHAPNKNKLYITLHHTTIYTSRVLSECYIQSSIYDKDAEMKSVKEIFDRRTSQRFEEYEERMKGKLQKHKEQRDKNIEKIIEKDKMEKSLADKVEKGCLMCGCALGGGVLPVWGLVSGLWYATLSQYVSTTVAKAAIDAGIEAGLKVGLAQVKEIVTKALIHHQGAEIPAINVLETLTTGICAEDVTLHGIFKCISSNINSQLNHTYQPFFTTVKTMAEQTPFQFSSGYYQQEAAVSTAFNDVQTSILTKAGNATSSLTTGITVSVIAIVVIVLIMVIIYLILRYRRKKKMKKKAQYTKLLNQ
ncbi:rifin PIR protein, putative [Plasmodium reichenowi]|uniref:Rifin n=1 Tax=Plasmodium reichenowi TaxID=5854 RepID=A0A060RQM1_PLARE|nr:rifin [Plasmodium reichenowi]SOV76618.1 rifin PIR protein, putative [Plasmodium reichenowi]